MNKYMLLLIIMASDVMAVDKIEPNKGTSIIKTEGESVTLSCSYDSDSSNVRLYCRAQEAQQSDVDPRFTVNITKKEHVDLEISSAAVSDSALYYCALAPTVTGNTSALYKKLLQ
ncbi:hypothetical protein Q8A67_008892 [Cirrhinus molitorella]|uniref:Ig-like domain-containing protein n=1 Tax=Cirrhinus molitorella TaxID=172907 RepID=A0AA88PU60_9TELE|nr:hypothetical protein Q8A67_008892 [Cirrhinus molitorella]